MNSLKQATLSMRPYKKYPFNKMLRLKIFFTVCKYNTLVNNLNKIYVNAAKVLTKNLTNNLIGSLYGDILIGGTSLVELEKTLQIQKSEGITCISGYMREGLLPHEESDAIGEIIETHMKSIDLMQKYDVDNAIAIKISCFANIKSLEHLNELQLDLKVIEDFLHESKEKQGNLENLDLLGITLLKSKLKNENAKNNIDKVINSICVTLFKESATPFTINIYEILNNNTENNKEKLNVLLSLFGNSLSEDLVKYVKVVDERLVKIISHANKIKLSVLIDAEETFVQTIIDNMVMYYIKKYNQEFCLIFHTIQCYLKEGPSKLKDYISFIKGNNLKFGLKLVKGAYLKIETKIANENKTENPINNLIDETHAIYDNAVSSVFEIVKPDDKVKLMEIYI